MRNLIVVTATVIRAARRGLSRLRHDTCGAAVVIAAILFPVVVGGMGLGAETGYWHLTQRKLQHAADVSAHAGAIRLRAGDSQNEIELAAKSVAAASGAGVPFIADPVVNWPPQASSNTAINGDLESVEVIITRSQPRLFSGVIAGFFGDGENRDVLIAARAVAQITSEPGSVACVFALSKTAGPAVTFSGSSSVTLEGCDVHSNSNAANSVEVSGSAQLSADCVSAVGDVTLGTHATLSNPACPKEQAGEISDPYGMVVQPTPSGACKNRNIGTPNSTTPTQVAPGNFCNGMALKGPVNFAPGVYVIHGGDVTVNAGENTSLTGTGVTFFLTGGARLRLNGHALLNLAAPTEGPYKGILFFGDRDDSVHHVVNGSSGSTLQGAIYAPGSAIDYRGNSATTNGCTQLIADTITFIGNSTMKSTCEAAGTEDVPTNQTVRLVE